MTVSPNTHCRVGRIKLKSGGAEVRVLHAAERGELNDKLVEHAGIIAGLFPKDDEMMGFVVVAWGRDGGFSRGTRIHRDSQVGETMIPSFVADVLRRDTMESVARDVLWGKT